MENDARGRSEPLSCMVKKKKNAIPVRDTEKDSRFQKLESKSIKNLLAGINREDHKVAPAIRKKLPAIEKLVSAGLKTLEQGGRIFYLGAGTSGRLGILDASELLPTFGLEPGIIHGIIAGGDKAIRKAVEFAEDDPKGAIKELKKYRVNKKDLIIGIAASGSTPFTVGALKEFQKKGVPTACITSNPGAEILKYSKYPICIETGPEFLTGSTRMKAGTAQKLVLNMISTTLMIKAGRVLGNKMVDMQLTNNKLIERGVRMILEKTSLSSGEARRLLLKHKSVRKVLQQFSK
jgi:N-acetylmuramic acid 6-phosphate etherase